MARVPRSVLVVAAALAVGLSLSLSAAAAAPIPAVVRSVAIVAPRWLYLDGELNLGIRVVTRNSTRGVAASLDLLDDSGVSRWHSYQSRSVRGSVTYEFSFSRAIGDIGIAPGVYRLRARVASAGSATVERSTQLIVVDRSTRPIPVCVVVRVAAEPSAGGDGSTEAEQESERVTASDAADLGQLAVLRPGLRLTLAVPPFLLEEWGAAPGAEQTSTPPAGVSAIDSLRRAVEAGTPLLRGMYADPDLSALATATVDLQTQAARGEAVAASFGAIPGSATATGFAALSGPLPQGVAAMEAARGILYAVTDTSSVVPARGEAVPEAYAVALPAARGSTSVTISVLAADRGASASLMDPARADALATDLFSRAGSPRRPHVVVLVVEVGGDGARTSAVAESLETLAGVPWVRFVNAPAAAAATGLPAATLREDPPDRTPAPDGYWAAVADARGRVFGLLAAAGASDPDAATALESLLLAESRAWAGPDGSWLRAERGRALAGAAAATADSVLSKVTLDAPSVTLPGSEGKVPVSIINSSGRTLTVDLEANSSDVRVQQTSTRVSLRPGENVESVTVSLGTATSGKVQIAVAAGGYRIAAATVTVTASYQDRIVLLVAVLVILGGLLLYVRRHFGRGTGRRAGTGGAEDGPEA
jgi:hypothetical protein